MDLVGALVIFERSTTSHQFFLPEKNSLREKLKWSKKILMSVNVSPSHPDRRGRPYGDGLALRVPQQKHRGRLLARLAIGLHHEGQRESFFEWFLSGAGTQSSSCAAQH